MYHCTLSGLLYVALYTVWPSVWTTVHPTVGTTVHCSPYCRYHCTHCPPFYMYHCTLYTPMYTVHPTVCITVPCPTLYVSLFTVHGKTYLESKNFMSPPMISVDLWRVDTNFFFVLLYTVHPVVCTNVHCPPYCLYDCTLSTLLYVLL